MIKSWCSNCLMVVWNHLVRKSIWIPICFFATTLIVYWHYSREITQNTLYKYIAPGHSENIATESGDNLDPDIIMDLAENYFRSAIKISHGKNVVDTDKCKIPDIDPWVPDVLKLVKYAAPRCRDNVNLTYVNYQNIVINETVLESLGYSFENISCCYQIIERVEETLDKYGGGADNKYKYSEECYPMERETAPIAGFTYVKCTATNSTGSVVLVYENLHLVAKISKQQEEKLSPKLSYWQTDSVKRPPSVLLFGIDSTSRLNFHRFMNATNRVLTKIGAFEMKGYTKIGDNTYPNIQAILSSYNSEELEKICLPKGWSSPQDNCPYLWRNFSRQNFLTAHFEDAPRMAIFNYAKTGFVHAPADIYIRPWMFASYAEHSEDKKAPFSIDCLGYQRPEDIIINYIVDLITLMESKATPYFITSWLTDLTHEYMHDIQTMDDILADALETLHKNKLLDNALVFVMSDHGYRWGDIRLTTSGWFEAKMPMMSIIFPEKLKEQYPGWVEALEYNSNQLTTPYDIHETLKDILRISNSSDVHNSTSTRGLSLFQKIPPRSCDDAGIPMEFCSCYPETPNTFDLRVIQLGAKNIIENINKDLPQNCSQLSIKKVTAALIAKEYRNETYDATDYSISFKAKPGNFRFEAVATYNNTAAAFMKISNVQRTNKKNSDTSCLSKSESRFELFCYCK